MLFVVFWIFNFISLKDNYILVFKTTHMLFVVFWLFNFIGLKDNYILVFAL